MCCREVQFYSISFIVPIYGIICNIVVLGIINKKRIKYNCELAGFNEEIDELLDEQYDNNNLGIIFVSSLSLAFYIHNLILELCLKFMKERNIDLYAASIDPPVSLQPAPVYSQMYPTSYGANMVPPNYPDNMAIPLTTN